MRQGPADAFFIQPVYRRDETRRGLTEFFFGEQIFCQQRNQRQRVHQRQQDRRDQSERERGEEISDNAFEQAQREKDYDRGQSRTYYRPDQFAGANLSRGFDVFSRAQMAVNVFHDDDGIVNHQADGDGQSPERHQVQRAAQYLYEKECRHDGQRQAHRRHDGDAGMMQE